MWPVPSSYGLDRPLPSRFGPCEEFWLFIEQAVERRFSEDLQYPVLWGGQLYQESQCVEDAVSPAGAGGIAQFMLATAGDISKRFGFQFDRFNARQAIDKGAYFQASLTQVFMRRERTAYEAHQLGQCAYNAGMGNCLAAQRKCDNARLWPEISNCLHLITGPHSAETKTYVQKSERWSLEMAGDDLAALPLDLQKKKADRIIDEATRRFGVRRYFSGLAWGTYWQIWDGWITADHVYQQVRANPPDFAPGSVTRRPGIIDAAFFGKRLPDRKPRPPIPGERVYIIGFPGGSDRPSLRYGQVYIDRAAPGNPDYTNPDTIVLIKAQPRNAETAGFEPVTGGMSGGLVMSDTYEPLCVLVSQNGQTDLTRDGIPDASADCVSLADIWEAFQ